MALWIFRSKGQGFNVNIDGKTMTVCIGTITKNGTIGITIDAPKDFVIMRNEINATMVIKNTFWRKIKGLIRL